MDYQEYVNTYQESVAAELRQKDGMRLESEWMLLSSEAQCQMIDALKQDVVNVENSVKSALE